MAQTIQSEEDIKKKHLATNYHKLIEVLFTISEKKTVIISEFGNTLTPENYNDKLEKFEFIDKSQRAALERHPQVSSLNALVGLTHDLQDIVEKL